MKDVDFIVVGQGIAGTLLAHDLLEKNQSVAIIDFPSPSSSSKVAAGIINPVAMKRCIPTNRAHFYLPKALERYAEIEKKLNIQFLQKKPILRLFSNNEVRHQWAIKYSNTEMSCYINRLTDANTYSFVKDEFGGAMVQPSAHINTEKFLNHSRDYFKTKAFLIEEEFDFDQFNSSKMIYKDLKSRYIIFCEGSKVILNPYFKNLPLSLTKGEVLTVQIPSVERMDFMISKGVYILPLGNYKYLLGSTYNHTDLTDRVTQQGQHYLTEKLKDILSLKFTIISSRAGVRPTVKDRQPLVGLHPFHSKIGVFNGLGSRGLLQGPLISNKFSAFLTQTKNITYSAENHRLKSFLNPG